VNEAFWVIELIASVVLDVDLFPDQSPDATQESAFVEVHARTDVPPETTTSGLAVKVTTGATAGGGGVGGLLSPGGGAGGGVGGLLSPGGGAGGGAGGLL